MSDKIDNEKDSLLNQINKDTLFRRHPHNEVNWNRTMFLLNEMRRDKYIRGSSNEDETYLSIAIRKEIPVIYIPLHASKGISEYVILNKLIRNCESKQVYPKTESVPIEFTKEDTPLNFINRITYSFDKDGTISKSIENEFWISELINYSSKEAGYMETVKDCDSDAIGIKVYRFKVSAPGKF